MHMICSPNVIFVSTICHMTRSVVLLCSPGVVIRLLAKKRLGSRISLDLDFLQKQTRSRLLTQNQQKLLVCQQEGYADLLNQQNLRTMSNYAQILQMCGVHEEIRRSLLIATSALMPST